MFEIAGGIILAVLFLASLPYIIASLPFVAMMVAGLLIALIVTNVIGNAVGGLPAPLWFISILVIGLLEWISLEKIFGFSAGPPKDKN